MFVCLAPHVNSLHNKLEMSRKNEMSGLCRQFWFRIVRNGLLGRRFKRNEIQRSPRISHRFPHGEPAFFAVHGDETVLTNPKQIRRTGVDEI